MQRTSYSSCNYIIIGTFSKSFLTVGLFWKFKNLLSENKSLPSQTPKTFQPLIKTSHVNKESSSTYKLCFISRSSIPTRVSLV